MRNILYVIIVGALLSSCANKQAFVGLVRYNVNYSSKMPKLFTSDSLTKMYGDMKTLFIQDSCYKYQMNGLAANYSLYDPEKNMIYNKINRSDTVYFFDAGFKSADSVLNYNIENNSAVVNGIKCDRLQIISKYSKIIYYYNKKYPVDYTNYTDHNYDNFNYYLKIAGAVPLKIIYSNNAFEYTMTFTQINREKVDPEIFRLEPDAILIKGLQY